MEIKGVMHVHSTYSYDGKENLTSLRDFLMHNGITFCFMTEHTNQMTIPEAQKFIQECKALSGSQFVFIPGFEVPYANTHILFLATELFLGQTATVEILRSWSAKSALTILAHPVRNKFRIDNVVEEVIDGVEIWNQQYEGKLVPRQHSLRLLNNLQEKRPELLATGGLDFHRREHFGSPVFTIDVEHISADAIVRAIGEGSYSFGNESIQVSSNGRWKGSGKFYYRLVSAISIGVISGGKCINASLAVFGLKLPKNLIQRVRSRV